MSDLVILFIMLFIFFIAFLSIFLMLIFSYKYTDLIEGHLSKSRFVANNREAFSDLGLIGKVLRSGSIASMFLIPRLCEKRGLIEKDELLSLPPQLKRMLIIPYVMGGVSFFAMLVFRFFFV
ncbi:hypothetical protein [Pseudomonas sp. KK4]|uniref:hypothetical protein n=1 Tax=Pseudomonas sp. KK4 TaxID=1855729 RepID=UPI00097C6837|nr:hypothetical protein [Pseudomonas sp. KK4]